MGVSGKKSDQVAGNKLNLARLAPWVRPSARVCKSSTGAVAGDLDVVWVEILAHIQ
jgi:hypothetical protein